MAERDDERDRVSREDVRNHVLYEDPLPFGDGWAQGLARMHKRLDALPSAHPQGVPESVREERGSDEAIEDIVAGASVTDHGDGWFTAVAHVGADGNGEPVEVCGDSTRYRYAALNALHRKLRSLRDALSGPAPAEQDAIPLKARVSSLTRPAPNIPDPPEGDQCEEEGCTSVATRCDRHPAPADEAGGDDLRELRERVEGLERRLRKCEAKASCIHAEEG